MCRCAVGSARPCNFARAGTVGWSTGTGRKLVFLQTVAIGQASSNGDGLPFLTRFSKLCRYVVKLRGPAATGAGSGCGGGGGDDERDAKRQRVMDAVD